MTTPQTTCPRCNGCGQIQDDKAVGAAMLAARQKAGVSRRELALRMNVSHQYLDKLEAGEKHWNEARKESYLSNLK